MPVVDRTIADKGKGGPRARFNGFGEAQGGTLGMGNYADGSYDYIIDRDHAFAPHAYDEFTIEGVVTSADFEHVSSYMTVGLVAKEYADVVIDDWNGRTTCSSACVHALLRARRRAQHPSV